MIQQTLFLTIDEGTEDANKIISNDVNKHFPTM